MSESNTVAMPMEKARLSLYRKMTPATQEVAKAFEEQLGNGAAGVVLIQYKLGARVAQIVEDEGTYGNGAVEQLAQFLAIPGGATSLYGMMNFSKTFDQKYVVVNSKRAMANGQFLTLTHWLNLMKIADEAKRTKWLEKVLKESMSANDLEKEIRSGAAGGTKNARQGGRKPKTPTSPMLGLQATYQLFNKLARWEETAEDAVFDKIDEMEPDKVTENLIAKAKETLTMATSACEKAEEMRDRLEKNVERLEEVWEKKAEEAAEDYDEDEEGEGKKKAVKPSTNGHAGKNGTGKKKKKKAKAAATTGDDD